MAGKCSHIGCPDPDTIGCNIEGESRLSDCKHYNKGEFKETDNTETEEDYYRIPWTGNSLGIIDLNYLTACSKPIYIGITGVASAGKTTFLASLYCLMRHGRSIGNYTLSGSLTLTGWEDISWYLSWKDNSNIQFPPHTSSNSGRIPGLLHLELRNDLCEKIDLIFTDAPGEWFDSWRNNVNSENAVGAKWIHENCDAFLLFADCETLEGLKRGQAKSQINSVADRLLENIENKPLGLIWSKSDISITQTTKEQITSHIKENSILHFNEFETSVKEGTDSIYHNNICESISWLIEKVNSNTNNVGIIETLIPNDMFLSKRNKNG